MLPLGPKPYRMNEAVPQIGMCLFFVLSGYLITMTLLKRPSVSEFLIRRLCRILPLAWLFLAVVLPLSRAPSSLYRAHFLFYANIPPIRLTGWTGHFWSLCVEVQFYVGVAILFRLAGRKSLWVLPFLALAVSAFRAWNGDFASIVTYHRIDEIFAGATLALVCACPLAARVKGMLNRIPPYAAMALLVICCHPSLGMVNYVRPYAGMLTVGSTLWRPSGQRIAWLESRVLRYLAEISYGLYVLHPLTMHGWFDPANKVVKYLRRPVGFALSFAGAHLSARFYESRWIALGKRYRADMGG